MTTYGTDYFLVTVTQTKRVRKGKEQDLVPVTVLWFPSVGTTWEEKDRFLLVFCWYY